MTARPSRDLLMATHQLLTQKWWELDRGKFELYGSQFVIRECVAGEPEMARKRIEALAGINVLDARPDTLRLDQSLYQWRTTPEKSRNRRVSYRNSGG